MDINLNLVKPTIPEKKCTAFLIKQLNTCAKFALTKIHKLKK